MKKALCVMLAVLLTLLITVPALSVSASDGEIAALSKSPGDVDGDGEITILDATYIQRYLAGLSSPLAAEELNDDELYARAVKDAMIAEESEILPLVNISRDDENVIWDGDRVLVLFMHGSARVYCIARRT